MKIQLDNRTHWRSDHLREFLKRGMHQERVDLCKRGAPTIRIVVKYNRGGDRHASVSGRATIGGNWCKIMVPSGSVDRIDLAHVVAHELAHTAGIEHAAMEGCPTYRRVGNWRELYAWADSLPLEKHVIQSVRPSLEDKIAHGEKMLAKALTREKRAVTLRKKWQARLKRWTKQNVEPAATVESH